MSSLSARILTKVLPLSLTGCLSLSHSWQKLTLTIWKEEGFFHYSNIPEFDFSVRLEHPPPPPLMSAVALPAAPRMHWNIYAGLFLLQGISLPFLFLYYFWCNAVQIHADESLINWNKVPVRRSLRALPHRLKPRRRIHLRVCFPRKRKKKSVPYAADGTVERTKERKVID